MIKHGHTGGNLSFSQMSEKKYGDGKIHRFSPSPVFKYETLRLPVGNRHESTPLADSREVPIIP